MRLKWLISVMALVTAVVVGVDLSAQQAPAPQAARRRKAVAVVPAAEAAEDSIFRRC